LCDPVAILNTTLRTIGRTDELRDRLFARTVTVQTRIPLAEPGRVFTGLPAVDGWQSDARPCRDRRGAAAGAQQAQLAAYRRDVRPGTSHHRHPLTETVTVQIPARRPAAA
jgi:hypothetical protein